MAKAAQQAAQAARQREFRRRAYMQNQSTSAFNDYVARQRAQTISRTTINRFGVQGQAFAEAIFL